MTNEEKAEFKKGAVNNIRKILGEYNKSTGSDVSMNILPVVDFIDTSEYNSIGEVNIFEFPLEIEIVL